MVDAAATAAAGRIATEDTAAHGQGRAASVTVVVDAAAAEAGRIATESAGADGQRRAASVTVVVDAAASAVGGRIATEGAVADGQRAGAGVDAATRIGPAIGDGQAGDGDDGARDVEHSAGGVAVDGQIGWAGTEDGHAVGHQQLAAGQQD